MLRRRRARDLVLVVAVVALGGAALADVLRDRTAEEVRDGRAATAATTDEREASVTTVEEPQAGQTPTTTTVEGEALVPRLPGGAASGAPSPSPSPAPASFGRSMSCRAECSTSLGWRRIAGSHAPRFGTRVAYSVHDDWGTSKRHFSILDLEHPRASFGDYIGDWNPRAWSLDGAALAWCDGSRSGFWLSAQSAAAASRPLPGSVRPSGVTGLRERPPGDRGRRAPAAESPPDLSGISRGASTARLAHPRRRTAGRPLRGPTPGGHGEHAAEAGPTAFSRSPGRPCARQLRGPLGRR